MPHDHAVPRSGSLAFERTTPSAGWRWHLSGGDAPTSATTTVESQSRSVAHTNETMWAGVRPTTHAQKAASSPTRTSSPPEDEHAEPTTARSPYQSAFGGVSLATSGPDRSASQRHPSAMSAPSAHPPITSAGR